MIKQWYSTTAAEFASMTDVTDEEVREASRGEVNKMTTAGEDAGISPAPYRMKESLV